MNIFAIIGICIVTYIIGSILYHKSAHSRYLKASRNIALSAYMKGIDTKDTSLMHHAVMSMCQVCPYGNAHCKIYRECPSCETKYGFKKELEEKYGKVITL